MLLSTELEATPIIQPTVQESIAILNPNVVMPPLTVGSGTLTVGNGLIPERGHDTNMSMSESELLKIMPQVRPYIHIFYRHPSSVEELREDYLVSKLWRMNNLYKVKTKSVSEDGGDVVVLFVMKPEQLVLYAQLSEHPRVIILKSRQVGMSTAGVLFEGDNMWTVANMKYGIIAQNQRAANDLKDKISFAFYNMDEEIKAFLGVRATTDNTDAFGLSNGSYVEGKMSFRSGTLQGLVWTEVGKIAANDPERVTETLSGSFQAIAATKSNWIIQESTAEGDNYFKNTFFQAEEAVGQPITNKGFRPLFFSWLTDKTCHSNIEVEISHETAKVARRIEKEYTAYIHTRAYKSQKGNVVYPAGHEYKMADSQLWWMQDVLKYEMGWDLELFHREYPHTPESAFFISNESAWYRNAVARMELEGRIHYDKEADGYRKIEYPYGEGGVSPLYKPGVEVFAFCDIGWKDPFHIVLGHLIETEKLDPGSGLPIKQMIVLGEMYGSGLKTDAYASELNGCPYDIDMVVLPHDGNRGTVLKDSVSVDDDFIQLGFDTYSLQVTANVVADVLYVRRLMDYAVIDGSRAPHTLASVRGYRKKFNKTLRKYESAPVHDWASHGADAFRYMGVSPVTCGVKSIVYTGDIETVEYGSEIGGGEGDYAIV